MSDRGTTTVRTEEHPDHPILDDPEGYLCYTKIYYCHHCVGETLHYRDDSDGMWTCPSCGGRWSA